MSLAECSSTNQGWDRPLLSGSRFCTSAEKGSVSTLLCRWSLGVSRYQAVLFIPPFTEEISWHVKVIKNIVLEPGFKNRCSRYNSPQKNILLFNLWGGGFWGFFRGGFGVEILKTFHGIWRSSKNTVFEPGLKIRFSRYNSSQKNILLLNLWGGGFGGFFLAGSFGEGFWGRFWWVLMTVMMVMLFCFCFDFAFDFFFSNVLRSQTKATTRTPPPPPKKNIYI